MNESQSGRTPEEKFKPETPREERLFEKAQERWYAGEWTKISQELGKDKSLVKRYEELLSDTIKKGMTEDGGIPATEKVSPDQSKKVERQEADEWTLESLDKIEKSNPEKLIEVFLGFCFVKNFVIQDLVKENKNQEAQILESNLSEKARAYNGQPPQRILIEWKNILSKYLPNSMLNITTLSEIGRDFTQYHEQ